MLHNENIEKLKKVDRERLMEVLGIIDETGIKFANKTLAQLFKKNKGEVSTYLNGKKPLPNDCYRTFIKQYGKGIEESKPISLLPHDKKENILQDNKELKCIESLINANQILARSNENLTKMQCSILQRIENANPPFTERDQKEIDLAVALKVEAVIERIVSLCIGQSWSSREEGLRVVGIALSGRVPSNLQ